VGVTPANTAETYVVGYWYQTPPGFAPASNAGATVNVNGVTTAAPFEDTGGQWALQTIGVAVIPGGSAPAIQVTIANPTAQDVRLDCAYVVPLVGGLIARTYDPSTQNLASAMDAGGATPGEYNHQLRPPPPQGGRTGPPQA